MSKFAPQPVREQLHAGPENQQRFLNVASVLRADFHEPDESYVTAKVFGDSFDNAFGASLMEPTAGFQEMVVVLYQDKRPICALNLATVLAGYAQYLKTDNFSEVGDQR